MAGRITLRKAMNYLLGAFNKQFMMFLVCCAISAFFWLILALNDRTKKEIEIPVRFEGFDAQVTHSWTNDTIVTVEVEGQGWNLLQFFSEKRATPLEINISKLSAARDSIIISSSELKRMMTKKLGNAKVNTVKPERLVVYLTKSNPIQLPVAVSGRVNTRDGYFVRDTVFVPEEVEVYTISRMRKKIEKVKTEDFLLEDLTADDSVTVRLVPPTGVDVVPNEVKMKFAIDNYMQGSFDVHIDVVNLPENVIMRFIPPRVKVLFTYKASNKDLLKPEDFKVTVDYKQFDDWKNRKSAPLKLVAPPYVINAMLKVESVDFYYEIRNH